MSNSSLSNSTVRETDTDEPVIIYLEPESRNIFKYGLETGHVTTTKLARLPYTFSADTWRQNTVAWWLID